MDIKKLELVKGKCEYIDYNQSFSYLCEKAISEQDAKYLVFVLEEFKDKYVYQLVEEESYDIVGLVKDHEERYEPVVYEVPLSAFQKVTMSAHSVRVQKTLVVLPVEGYTKKSRYRYSSMNSSTEEYAVIRYIVEGNTIKVDKIEHYELESETQDEYERIIYRSNEYLLRSKGVKRVFSDDDEYEEEYEEYVAGEEAKKLIEERLESYENLIEHNTDVINDVMKLYKMNDSNRRMGPSR